MIRFAALAVALAVLCLLPARAEIAQGTWSISTAHGSLQLETRWRSVNGHMDNEHSGAVDAASLGIANALASSGQHATFALHREAGDFAFDGWIGRSQGAGSYTFTPNDGFFNRIRARGYSVDTMDFKMAFADLDITTAYIDGIERVGYKVDVNNLVAMKALGVSPQYVAELKAAGVAQLGASDVISLKALHVDAQYIADMAASGFSRLTADQYVTLKAMHVDTAYIKYLRDHGFKNLTVDQVVTLKAEHI